MIARAASGLVVSALIRRVTSEGGFAAVLARGDDTAGGILIACTERGEIKYLIEQGHDAGGGVTWRDTGRIMQKSADFGDYQARRRQADPDLWIVELDIPNAERFAAEMIADS